MIWTPPLNHVGYRDNVMVMVGASERAFYYVRLGITNNDLYVLGTHRIDINLFFWIEDNNSWTIKDTLGIRTETKTWNELRDEMQRWATLIRRHYTPATKLEVFYDQCELEHIL